MAFADLFRPKRKHSHQVLDPSIAAAKETDQAVLARIAKNDSSRGAREIAIKKLTDQAVLADVAKSDSEPDVRRAAVERVTSQAVLADVARNDISRDVRMAAVDRIRDEAVLANVALNDSASRVRSKALKGVHDQRILAVIAMKGSLEAVEELMTEPLAEVAKSSGTPSRVRVKAVGLLMDEALLGKLIKDADDESVRKAATERLETLNGYRAESERLRAERERLRAETERLRAEDERLAAVGDCSDQTQLAAAMNDPSGAVREAAVENLVDQTILGQVAKNDANPSVRCAAVGKLTDQGLLGTIAQHDMDPTVRLSAVIRVTDKAILNAVATHELDGRVLKAAVTRLNEPFPIGATGQLQRAGTAQAPLEQAIAEISETNWNKRRAHRARIGRAIDYVGRTRGGVDRLACEFFGAREEYKERYLGAALAMLGRKDLLMYKIQRADRECGIGRRHEYWNTVLRIARTFAEGNEPDGIALALLVLQKCENAGSLGDDIHGILRATMDRASEKVSQCDLGSLQALPAGLPYKHTTWDSDSLQTASKSLADVHELVQSEIARRKSNSTLAHRK
jgi:hypothetical protein